MKKLISVIVIIAIVSYILLPSCKKNQANEKSPTLETTTLIKLKIYDSTYLQNQKKTTQSLRTTQTPPSWKKTVATDCASGLTGSFLGPFGVFCAASVGSILYAFYDLGLPPNDTTSINTSNPYDIYGQMHNQDCYYIVSNNYDLDQNNNFSIKNTIDNSESYGLANFSPTLRPSVDTISDSIITVLITAATDTALDPNSSDTDIVNATVNANLVSFSQAEIINQYLVTLFCADDPVGYSIGAENVILSSVDLTPSQREQLLIGMAIARNSVILWPQ